LIAPQAINTLARSKVVTDLRVFPLKPNLPRQNIRPHAPITGEAVKGVFEGGGAVVFEEEVAYPCEGVALQHTVQNQHGLTGQDGGDYAQEAYAGAYKMQATRGLVTVFAEVKRVKIVE
jgi:hypothetical protein